MVCAWQKQEGKCSQLEECLDAEERVQFREAPTDVPRRDEKIPHEPREKEPARPVRAPVNEPYPQEHHSKESCGYTNLSRVCRDALDHRASKSERKVQHQKGCRPFNVSRAESPIVICIPIFRVHVLLLLNNIIRLTFMHARVHD